MANKSQPTADRKQPVKRDEPMNPFEHRPMRMEDSFMDWSAVYPQPYDKMNADPYTKARIILMNGIEVEATMFKHQFHRNCADNDIRRDIALSRRIEQVQQKHINWLKPIDETPLETTIGYEQLAVDLTAWLAMNEPDPYVKQALDFALLEDFDHLYRFANLLDLDEQIPAEKLTKGYVDITPGRPTIAHHRHPYDTVRLPMDSKTADDRTKLHANIIVAGEQQTMNYYMNVGPFYQNDLGRQLYQEIAMVEEQHVTHYGSLLDPNCTWFENALMHEYTECYLYYSFYQDEVDPDVKRMWEMHFEQEVAHLHRAVEMLAKYEGKDWQQVVKSGKFPKLLRFFDTRDYVRKVLADQVRLTADRDNYMNVEALPKGHEFFQYQEAVNCKVDEVPSHMVIEMHIKECDTDYRSESMENPIEALRDRKMDNTDIARMPELTMV